jgi:hypothetical protein
MHSLIKSIGRGTKDKMIVYYNNTNRYFHIREYNNCIILNIKKHSIIVSQQII